MEVISTALDKHGQGGNWQESVDYAVFHSSFLVADRSAAWVLETAGQLWAAKKLDGNNALLTNLCSFNVSRFNFQSF